MQINLTRLEREDSQALSKKGTLVFMVALAGYSIVRGIAGAASRPFWFDELLTLSIAGQPDLHSMWVAISRGFDSQPPVFYLLERICLALPISKEISLRLPSIFSFPLLLACVFTFAKKCSGQLIACLCAGVMLSTSLFHLYLIEARGYMLMNACIAFALVCYQRLPSPRWTVMLGLSLFLAESFHYYAVFAMVPFGLAEMVFFAKEWRFRWPVWAAMTFGVVPLIVCRPLLTTIKTYYGSHLFSRPGSLHGIWIQPYGSYFFLSDLLGAALAAVAVAAILWASLQSDRVWFKDSEAAPLASVPAQGVLLISLTLLPLILFGLITLMNGSLLDRYGLPATVTIALGLACLLRILNSRATVIFGLFIVCSLGLGEVRFWRHQRYDQLAQQPWYNLTSREQFQKIENFMQTAGRRDLPIVFIHPHVYCQLFYYVPSFAKQRLVYLMDRNRELKYRNYDSMYLNLLGLGEFFPLNLSAYGDFTVTHSEFLLYADRPEWQLESLRDDGASLQLLRADGSMRLFLVKMQAASMHSKFSTFAIPVSAPASPAAAFHH